MAATSSHLKGHLLDCWPPPDIYIAQNEGFSVFITRLHHWLLMQAWKNQYVMKRITSSDLHVRMAELAAKCCFIIYIPISVKINVLSKLRCLKFSFIGIAYIHSIHTYVCKYGTFTYKSECRYLRHNLTFYFVTRCLYHSWVFNFHVFIQNEIIWVTKLPLTSRRCKIYAV